MKETSPGIYEFDTSKKLDDDTFIEFDLKPGDKAVTNLGEIVTVMEKRPSKITVYEGGTWYHPTKIRKIK